MTGGFLFVALGAIGIVLPLLPTTPFLLLAVFLFAKSSKKFHHWLIHHKVFGKYIYNYTVHKAITKRSKITSVLMLWITLTLSMFLVYQLLITVILTSIGIAVTWHLLSMKTL